MRDLNERETITTDLYLDLASSPEVVDKTDAARYALSALPDRWIDTEFVHWLSEGTLTRVGHHLLRVEHLDDSTHPLTRDL